MARREVIEITCDRCSRTETQPKVSEPVQSPELRVMFHGVSVEYSDLCIRCRSAVENYFKSMTKKQEEEKPQEPEPEQQKKGGFLGIGKG